jgi:hypothetical protein
LSHAALPSLEGREAGVDEVQYGRFCNDSARVSRMPCKNRRIRLRGSPSGMSCERTSSSRPLTYRSQQRQGAHLISASRAEFAHMPDKAAIERDQQIEEKN